MEKVFAGIEFGRRGSLCKTAALTEIYGRPHGTPNTVEFFRAMALAPILVIATFAFGQQRVSSLTGDVRTIKQFHSKILNNDRDIVVYLPPGYSTNISRRYPVLYLHDGQNVFDGMTSFIPNKEWRADESAEALIRAGLIEPLIMVGIYNHGAERAEEYLPTRAKFGNNFIGGKADLYAKMLVEEIMPMIDKAFRTKIGPQNTGICGSSFGGIVTMHLGLTHPNVFGKLAVVSPSVWWDSREILREVDQIRQKPRQRIWVDIGTEEAGTDRTQNMQAVDDAAALTSALIQKGWTPGKDLAYFIDKGAHHSEEAWAHRMPMILLFLFRK